MVISNIRWLCIAIFFAAALSQNVYAQAVPVNNGTAMVMGGMRGGTMGRPTNVGYSTGSAGLTATYNQPMRKFSSAANDPHFNPRVTARTPKPGLMKGIKGFLKSPIGRANIYTTIIVWGLSEFAEREGWFFENDDAYILDLSVEQPIEKGWNTHPNGLGKSYNTVKDYISDIPECSREYYAPCASYLAQNQKDIIIRGKNQNGSWLLYNVSECPTGAVLTGLGCVSQEKRPVTDADINDLFNSPALNSWSPPPNVPEKEVKKVYPYVPSGDTIIEVEPQIIEFPNEITTMPDGTVKETTRRDTATVANPNTDPALVTTTQTTTKTFENGQMTANETVTTTTDATASTSLPEQAAQTQAQQQEQVTDCALVPTLCATQKEQLERDKARDEWLRDDRLPPEPDLSNLKPVSEDFNRHYPINIGNGQCPAPISLNTTLAGTLNLSFDPFCDFASKLRYLVIAGATLFAAYILLGVVRRG
ncbi:virulence factor TspB C-terminal domain-related protein [Suttonella ornithocola]|uniref:Neisseria meningitidis TspB protein n=1 Tax=Suttonella ornithocola TaxID=279832 RepID=A0A380N0B3_9GAMM|nr:virulence factor TspB C-terminal domain-related protein [Suttonella ornithocola]SUO97361.1 Neisseria meningitidis TspB protein [Suttonella ornithocola]